MKTSKIIVLVGCAVGGILFLTAGFVLYRSIVRFNTSNDDLNRVKLELASYYEASIFPSAENVEQELENTRQVDLFHSGQDGLPF